MVKKLKIFIFFIITFFLISCSNAQKEKLKIFAGHKKYRNSKFDEALVAFFQAKSLSLENDYAEFGIATVYLSKNKDKKADEKFKILENSKSEIIRSNVFYQRGIIQFQNGNYIKAKDFFKKSMESNVFSVDAKINYEICKNILRHTDTTKLSKEEEEEKKETIKSDITDEKIIFDLIKKKEEKKCKQKQNQKATNHINDY